jgi:LPS-assembly protein
MRRVAQTALATCTELLGSLLRRVAAGSARAAAFALPLMMLGAVDASAASKSQPSAFPKTPGGVFGAAPKLDKALPLYLQGDQLIYDTKGNRVIARGNVEIFYNNNVLTADEVIYDQGANTLTASGNVELKDVNGNVIRADRYTLTDDFRDGFVQSLSVVARDDSRITAERAERREGNVTEFTKGTFTACKSENGVPPLWCIGARKITHDQAAGTISYQDAQFELFGQPVFYMPYFQHPDASVKRKSGFLMPEYGNSEQLGAYAEIPYYFALAPSYDFTFHPRYMTEQGVLWQGDWRQKIGNGEYSINLAGIDQDADKLPSGTNPDLGGWRGSLETRGNFSLSSWWSMGWDATIESDDSFRRFYKLDSVLLTDRVDEVWLKGISDRNYFGAHLYHFGGLLVNDTPDSESVVHPIIDHNYIFQDPVLGGELSWTSNVLSFSRNDANISNGLDQSENRIVTELKWRRKLTDAIGISYTPFAEARGDFYQIDNFVDPDTLQPFSDETVVRGMATGGATVSYPWVANTGSISHVIEPIGQIVAHNNNVRQQDMPNEDAKSLVFDDTNLFETTKFSGYDRLETGVRANVGVQYTFQSPVGHARVLAGQSYQLSGHNSYSDPTLLDPTNPNSATVFSPQSGLQNTRSDYILGVYLAPTDAFRLISQSRFDERDLSLMREDVTGLVSYGPLSAQATYTYTAVSPSDIESTQLEAQQDILGSIGLRLTNRWSVHGAIRYDLDADETLTDSIQLAYLDECFMLSATYSETFITDESQGIEPDRTVMLRFELKHLGGFNYQTSNINFAGGEDGSVPTIANQR